MHTLGLLLVLLSAIWLVGVMGFLTWLTHWSLDTRGLLAVYPALFFLVSGVVLVVLRFLFWLQQIAGVHPWWDDER